jgi:predicted CXXCH cytochrome family protein
MISNKYRFLNILLTAAIVISLISCRSSHKVLSTFFDGVPEPRPEQVLHADSLRADSAGMPAASTAPKKPPMVIHSPYQDKACDDCHTASRGNALSEPQPDLCYTCHDDFRESFKALHGPVAAGFCTECHNPHLSKNEKLLVRTGQPLCLYCHEATDVFKNENHEGIDDMNCTDCHDPHGGEDRFLLD